MRSEVTDAETGTSVESAPEKGVEEQTPSSLSEYIAQQLKDEGQIAEARSEGPAEPVEHEPVAEAEAAPVSEESTPIADSAEVEPEEEEPGKPNEWPASAKARVAEEAAKRRKLKEENEALRKQLDSALSSTSAVAPSPDDPVADIQNPQRLSEVERVYEAAREVDLDEINDDGTITMPADFKDGKLVYQNVDPKTARLYQVRAERAVRKFIPQRRQVIDERGRAEAEASKWYPDLGNPDHDFTKTVNRMVSDVLSGRAANDPTLKVMCANAIYGAYKRTEEAKALAGKNGNSPESNVKKIVQGSKVKVAPSSPIGRSIPKKSGAELAQAKKRMDENPSDKGAMEDFIKARLQGSAMKAVLR